MPYVNGNWTDVHYPEELSDICVCGKKITSHPVIVTDYSRRGRKTKLCRNCAYIYRQFLLEKKYSKKDILVKLYNFVCDGANYKYIKLIKRENPRHLRICCSFCEKKTMRTFLHIKGVYKCCNDCGNIIKILKNAFLCMNSSNIASIFWMVFDL